MILSYWIFIGIILMVGGILLYRLLISIRQLKKSENDLKKYYKIVHEANDAILVINIANGKIIETNQEAAKLLGYTKKELLSLTVFKLFKKNHLAKSSEYIAQSWEKNGLVFSDLPYLSKNGESIDVECSTRVLDFGDQPAIVLYIRDIRERIRLQNILDEKHQLLVEKNGEIEASLRYAQQIQHAFISGEIELKECFKKARVFYQPRDIIGGDFIWAYRTKEITWLAVGDCTGHGISGGLLATLSLTLLSNILETQNRKGGPADILNILRNQIISFLRNEEAKISLKDGMDIVLLKLVSTTKELTFSAANSAIITQNTKGDFKKHKGDRMPVGQHPLQNVSFTEKKLDWESGMRIFLYSDGVVDQFGGTKNKKFKRSRLTKAIESRAQLPLEQQFDGIIEEFEDWKNNTEQTDDILFTSVEL